MAPRLAQSARGIPAVWGLRNGYDETLRPVVRNKGAGLGHHPDEG